MNGAATLGWISMACEMLAQKGGPGLHCGFFYGADVYHLVSNIAIEWKFNRLETACSVNRRSEDMLFSFPLISLISFFFFLEITECSGFSHPCMQSRKWNENRWQNLIFWGMCMGKIPSGWEVTAPAYLWTKKNVLRGWPLNYPCPHSSCLTHNQTEASLSKASSCV